MADKKFFDLLQVYRGFAALLVVIHHTTISFMHFKKLNIPSLEFFATIGKYGVDFFFVLSGFIIAFSTLRYRDQPKFLRKYVFNRIIRIYVPYLPISIAMLILYNIFPELTSSNRSVSTLTSLTLIPYGNPALSVAWTLVFEMFFYIIYGVNFLSKKIWYILLILWISSILVVHLFDVDLAGALTNLIFSMYNFEFIFGVFIAYLIKLEIKIDKFTSLFFAISTATIFLLFKYYEITIFHFSTNLIFVLSMCWFIYLAIEHFNIKLNNRSIIMMIGNSSYSLYLLHNPIQSFLTKLIPDLYSRYLLFLEFVLVLTLCCGISYIYFLVFEKRILNMLKRRFEPVY